MAEGVTVANAFVQVMPSADGATEAITKTLLPDMQKAGDSAGKGLGNSLFDKAKSALKGAGPAMLGAMGVSAVVKSVLDIGNSFESMKNTIIVGTGASGDALDALCESAKSISTSVNIPFEQSGDIVQDLNTRMGLVGKDLADVGQRVAAAGKMIGEPVDLSALTGSLNAYGVANDEAAGKMDYLFSVAQATGIGFNSLTSIIESNAPVMKELGFSYEETANMAGLLDKAGMDATGVMSKMSRALVNLAEPGQSASDAFDDVIGELQGYIEAGDNAAAIDVASKVFGTKGAAQFVGALESGAFSLDQIRDSALGAGEGIMGTMEETMTWQDKLGVIGNKVIAKIEPVASGLVDLLEQGLDGVDNFVEGISPAIEGLVGLFGPAMELIGSIASDTFGFMSTTAIEDVNTLASVGGDAIGTFTALMNGDFEGAASHACSAFETIRSAASAKMQAAGDFIGGVADRIGAALGFPGLGDTVRGVFDGIAAFIEDPLGTARDTVHNIVEAIKGFFSFEIKLPDIKLPHIHYDLIEIPVLGEIPNPATFRIDWYARGGIIDTPTLIGAGEAGAEAIVPLTHPNIRPWAEAVASELNGGGGVVYNCYWNNTRVEDGTKLASAMKAVAREAKITERAR